MVDILVENLLLMNELLLISLTMLISYEAGFRECLKQQE